MQVVTELGKTIRLRMGGKRRDEEGAVRINLGKQFYDSVMPLSRAASHTGSTALSRHIYGV